MCLFSVPDFSLSWTGLRAVLDDNPWLERGVGGLVTAFGEALPGCWYLAEY